LDELGRFKDILHDSDTYRGRVAYFKSSSMDGKVLIFSSGKMISVGTTSEEKAISELEQTEELLVDREMIGAKPRRLQTKIRNIVVTADFRRNIDLEELSKRHKMIYEPEQFPGGILRVEEPYKATVLVFASGKAVITGLKSSRHIKPSVDRVAKIIDSQSI